MPQVGCYLVFIRMPFPGQQQEEIREGGIIQADSQSPTTKSDDPLRGAQRPISLRQSGGEIRPPTLRVLLTALTPVWLLRCGPCSPDRSRIIGMLWNDEAAEAKVEPFHLLHEAEDTRQLTRHHDIFLAAGACGCDTQHRYHLDD